VSFDVTALLNSGDLVGNSALNVEVGA